MSTSVQKNKLYLEFEAREILDFRSAKHSMFLHLREENILDHSVPLFHSTIKSELRFSSREKVGRNFLKVVGKPGA